MEILLLTVVGLLLLAAVVAAVAYGAVRLAQRRRGPSAADPGIGTPRRLYLYVVTLAALVTSAFGLVFVATFVVESIFVGGEVAASTTGQAVGLSMTVVGLPLWWLHWRLIERHVTRLPVETRSVVRKLFVYVVLALGVGFVAEGAVSALSFVARVEDFDGRPWAAMIVWGGVWAFHWRREASEGQPTAETLAIRRIYLYGVAGSALVTAAAGLGWAAHLVLREAYDALVLPAAAAFAGVADEQVRRALVLLLVGGVVWAGHWVHFARDDGDSVFRQVYLYVLAQFVPFVTVFVTAIVIVDLALVWAVGAGDNGTADHFRSLPGALAVLLVAGGVLGYHHAVAREETQEPASEARGGYVYALAGVGLLALAFAISMLVDTVFEFALERETAVSTRHLLGQSLALVLAIGLIGGSLWGYFWSRMQRSLRAAGPEERVARPRWLYLTAAQGVGMLALIGGLSVVVYALIKGILAVDLTDFFDDGRAGLAVLAPVGVLLPYHWLVYKEDRRIAGPGDDERTRKKKSVTVLAGPDGWEFVSELERALGYAVTPLEWADGDARTPRLSSDEIEELAGRIGNLLGSKILIVPDNGAVRLFSYE